MKISKRVGLSVWLVAGALAGVGMFAGLSRAEESTLINLQSTTLESSTSTESAPQQTTTTVIAQPTTETVSTAPAPILTAPVTSVVQTGTASQEVAPVESTPSSPAPLSGSLGTLDLNNLKVNTSARTITLVNPPIDKSEKPVKKFVPVPPVDGVEDQDGDGLTDTEEKLRGTSPTNPDTDGDGYSDSDELRSGYNPLKFSAGDKGDKIEFQSPKEVIETAKAQAVREGKTYIAPRVQNDAYKIEKIERVKRDDGKNVTRLSGRALPNTLVTVYVFSDPIVVVVKTDKQGNWSYDLERDLEDGDHEAYVAVTDNIGQITAQSSPLPFVKTAEAVSIRTTEAAPVQSASPMDRWKFPLAVIAVILMISFFSMGVVLIRHFSRGSAKIN